VAQGELITTSDELHGLLKALRSKDFHVTTIRNHMAGEHPQYLFVRFWKQGKAVELAKGLRYALDAQVGATRTVPPIFVGWMFAHPRSINFPFFFAGILKITYDLLLYREFSAIRPAEEECV